MSTGGKYISQVCNNFKFVSDLGQNYCLGKMTGKEPSLPQDYVMDISEDERFMFGSYPKLKQLLEAKTKLIRERNHPPIVYNTQSMRRIDLMQFDKFDVMVLKLPLETWSLDELQNSIRMDLLADAPSFIVLGCGGTTKGLQLGRKLIKEWGFRRAEDIIWLRKSDSNSSAAEEPILTKANSVFDLQNQIFTSSKEHFLVGIRGTIKRNVDTHFINSNLDTDVIVTDFKQKVDFPLEIFHIMERLCLGRKRVFLQFQGQKIETEIDLPGWLTIRENPLATESKFDSDFYQDLFIDPQTGQPDRYLGTTEEIENLRPKSPSA